MALIGPAQLRKMAKVRFVLERLAAAEVCAAAAEGDDVYFPLEEITERMRTASANEDRRALIRLDIEFHRTLCELSGNEAIVRAWESMTNSMRIMFGLAAIAKAMLPIAEDHVQLLRDLRRGCPADLDRALQSHVFDNVLAVDYAGIVERLREARWRPSA